MTTVRDVMSSELTTAGEDLTVGEAATTMGLKGVGSILVMAGKQLAGIFTERDIVHALTQDMAATGEPIGYFMTRNPITVAPDTEVGYALNLMLERHFRHLPVVEDNEVLGMVSIRDLSAAAGQG